MFHTFGRPRASWIVCTLVGGAAAFLTASGTKTAGHVPTLDWAVTTSLLPSVNIKHQHANQPDVKS